MIDIEGIKKMIPHRYPFLLIDKIIELKNGESAIAQKNVTVNEQFFNGHFDAKPVMPGVLIIEAMAQTAACIVNTNITSPSVLVYFTTIEKARFRKIVIPGDVLILKVTKLQQRLNLCKMSGEAYVDNQKVAEAEFSAMLVDIGVGNKI